ncbi:hypothetical protein BJY52DRAFT_1272489 [Lactarius psammicola]|nr:hypothetical protein BJY52DRAFT_1272489 [Lactarius psammicola]
MKVLVRVLVMLTVSEMRPMRAEVGAVSASVPHELANHLRHIKISSSRPPIILTTPPSFIHNICDTQTDGAS